MKKQSTRDLWDILEEEFLSKKVTQLSFPEIFQIVWEKKPNIIRISSKVQLPSDRKLMKLLGELESKGRINVTSLDDEIIIELPKSGNINNTWVPKHVKVVHKHPHFENENLQPSWHSWRETLGLPMGIPKSELFFKIEELLDSIPVEFQKERSFVESQITSLTKSQLLGQKQPFRHQIQYDGKSVSVRLGTFTKEDVLDLLPDNQSISLQELFDRAGAISEADKPRLRSSIKQLIDRNLIEKTSRGIYIRKKIPVPSPKKKRSLKKHVSYHHKKFIETMKILSKKGLIKKKQQLIGNHKGKVIKAVLLVDEGQIELQGKTYFSLSAAAKATGDKKSGWLFWHILNEKGDLIPVKKLRDEIKHSKSSSSIER
ncbi:MAG: hypothetical protein ACFE9L_11085 [Candidatus Hodarchaeota archaeon]